MRRLPLRSPPRMRGKVWLHQKPGRVPGITPACAGKSTGGHHTDAVYRDHPRVCGEKVLSSCWIVSLMGSPPRMRGKVFARLIVFAAGGITPAYAGKSRRFASLYDSIRDHPRVCGEKYSLEKVEKVAMGSPPRMRGKAVPLRSAAASGCRGPSVPEYDAPP